MKRTWGVVFIALGAILAVWIVYVLFVERLPWFKIGSSGLFATALITVGVRWLNEPQSRASARRSSAEPITMTCPACDLTMRVPAKYAGKMIRCKECREEFRVDDVLEEVMPDGRLRRKKKAADLPLRWIIGIGVPVLVVFGVFIYLMSRGGGGIAAEKWKTGPQGKSANRADASQANVSTFGTPAHSRAILPEGPKVIALSAPRHAYNAGNSRHYEFPYQFQGATPQAGEVYYLVARTVDGLCDFPIDGGAMKPSDTLVARFGSEPHANVMLWFERRQSSGAPRERISNIVSLSWPPR